MRVAEHRRPDYTLVHLADTHLLGNREDLLHGVAAVAKHLATAAEEIVALDVPIDGILVTGDLADRGEPAAYELLGELLGDVGERLGAPVVWCMGNHDDRTAMRTHLLGVSASAAPYDEVVWIDGLRVIVLDSTVPGQHWGRIEPSQLDWLRRHLASPAPDGTLLALHHPPVPCVQDLAVTVELVEQEALAKVVEGTDVRGILAGHLHYSTSAMFAGVPVHVAAATCYTQDLTTPRRGTRGRDEAQAFHLVHVYQQTLMSTVVPLRHGATVGRFADGAATDTELAAMGLVIPPARRSRTRGARGTSQDRR